MVLPASILLLLSLIPRLLSVLAGALCFFSFLPSNAFQFVSPLTSAFEGRVGTVLSQPEISAGVVAEAILLDPHVPMQGHVCAPTSPAWWHGGAGRDGARTQVRYPGNLQGKQVFGLSLLQTKCTYWLF